MSAEIVNTIKKNPERNLYQTRYKKSLKREVGSQKEVK